MVRSLLDALYRWSGLLAGAFLVAIGISVVAQIVCRIIGTTFDATEVAGFCLAASTFFGLAHTFRAGGHVRITLAIDWLPPRPRRIVEVCNCLIAAAAIVFVAWNLIALMQQSYSYHDVSPGLLAVPFWIPQLGAAAGVTVFAIALLDELVWIVRGRAAHYDAATEPHYE